MNATERLVENYFRIVKRCFTVSDVKVAKGNNRQFDLLAFQPLEDRYYHVEVHVTHVPKWCFNLSQIENKIDGKFFGAPDNKRPENSNTDFAKSKSYLKQIQDTYSVYGIEFSKVIRVWCEWCYQEDQASRDTFRRKLSAKYGLPPENFMLLSFRDHVLKELNESVGTSNYDDEIMRTLSVLREFASQTKI